MKFTVPGAPVPKERPRVVGRRAFTPQRTRDYEARVKACAIRAGVKIATLAPVRVEVVAYCQDARRRDLDNLCKSILDPLNGLIYADDSQIVRLVAEKRIDRENPRAEIEIEEAI